ncbi:hypothetical protein [Pseudidiomarina terrestris]|uniref:hypothetical protein n=1 Tax=Pseudidiomarina terrestris TaxID=2820060 RepID=UPI00264B681E|nr:hypothetical protein [Pseudidiomarina sp. 1ASP75-5]MDN7134966.1 hypothetical protein [Pseudidiomarina sp. 1ASP75-5]
MKNIDVSGGDSHKAKKRRAIIAFGSLLIASLVIYFIGTLVVNFYGFELQTKIRDVDLSKVLLVFITMLPIVGLVVWGTLAIINRIFRWLNI